MREEVSRHSAWTWFKSQHESVKCTERSCCILHFHADFFFIHPLFLKALTVTTTMAVGTWDAWRSRKTCIIPTSSWWCYPHIDWRAPCWVARERNGPWIPTTVSGKWETCSDPLPEVGRPGETLCHRERQSPPQPPVVGHCGARRATGQFSRGAVWVWQSHWFKETRKHLPGARAGQESAAAPCWVLEQQGYWESCLPAAQAVPCLLSCPCCQAVPLLALGTRSHHVPPALLVPVLLLRKLHLATACRAPFRFTVFHYCVSGTWRRTAACVLCTLTSDRTLAGNGSTSLRATLLTFVQALARTFAAQTPLTARYIQYIILLVAVIAPSP